MIRSFKKKTVAIAAVGVLAVAGAASAAVTGATKEPTPLTGSITDKVSDAALSKYPGGTLVGLESEPDGSYEAQVRKTDGGSATVTLDKDFAVTATHDGWGRGGHGGPGGPGRGGPGRGVDTAALAKSLGVDEAKLTAALDKVRPDKADRRSEIAAAIAKSLGVQTADVQAVLDAQLGPDGGPGPGRGPGRDGGELVSALAKKLGISEDKVRSALEAARPARPERGGKDELAAALAKELGLDASKVQSALEAARPAGRP
jgi:hypothetical protein